MVTNGVDRPTSLPSGYVTIGAGARAHRHGSTGNQGFGVDEDFGRDRAGVVFTTRTGIPAGDGLVYMPITETIDANDSELFGAEPGLLGDELATAGIARAVITNGDGTDPSTPDTRSSPWRRAAVAALMTSAGKVPGGRVDDGLLRQDAGRAVRRAPRSRPGRPRVHRRVAAGLGGAGRGLRPRARRHPVPVRVRRAGGEDARRARSRTPTASSVASSITSTPGDLVMVVGPTPPQARDALSVAAVRGPGFEPGLLRSTTTQRNGFVNLTDVAPTILTYFGLDRPDEMEGRRMETGEAGGTLAEHREFLVNVNEDGLFRDGLVGQSMSVVMVLAIVLALRRDRARPVDAPARAVGGRPARVRRAVVARLPRRHVSRGPVPLRAQRRRRSGSGRSSWAWAR